MRKIAVMLVAAVVVVIGSAASAGAATCVTVYSGPDSVTVCTP